MAHRWPSHRCRRPRRTPPPTTTAHTFRGSVAGVVRVRLEPRHRQKVDDRARDRDRACPPCWPWPVAFRVSAVVIDLAPQIHVRRNACSASVRMMAGSSVIVPSGCQSQGTPTSERGRGCRPAEFVRGRAAGGDVGSCRGLAKLFRNTRQRFMLSVQQPRVVPV